MECAVVFAGVFTEALVEDDASVRSAVRCHSGWNTWAVVDVSEARGIVPMSNVKMNSTGSQRQAMEHPAPLPAGKPAVLVECGITILSNISIASATILVIVNVIVFSFSGKARIRWK